MQFQDKDDFYWRLFAEIFVYLGQYKPIQDWCGVAIFATRRLDPGLPIQYRSFLMSGQLKVLYLDELMAQEITEASLGWEMVQ